VAYTSEDLAKIRSAIARGERSVQFADRTVTYRDVSELLKAEDRIARALAAASTTTRSKLTRLVSGKGL
jgi:hypothetical protein